MCAFTGMRHGEVKSLTTEHVHPAFDRIELTRSTKAKRNRTIPLTGPAVDAVRALVEQAEPGGKLFPASRFPSVRTLQQDCQDAGIDPTDVGFHSLRKAFAGRCAIQGVDLRVAQAVLGRSDPKLTASIYTRLTGGEAMQAMAKFA